MARCPHCHRRLLDDVPCPRDGGLGRATSPSSEETAAPVPPVLSGVSVGGLLGNGGFAAVWEAVRGTQRLALKVAHQALTEEVDAQRRVGAPFAPAVVEAGALPDGRFFLLQERVDGPSLDRLLAAAPIPFAREGFYEVARAVLTAVEGLHSRGVVHRDLKPENLFLLAAPTRAVVIDYGAALVEPATASPRERVGTAEYIAPEQLRGDPQLGVAADLYSLGVLFFELLTLRLPFTGNSHDLEYAHLNLRPPRPSSLAPVPASLEQWVLRCLHKDPLQRPESAALLLRELEGIAAGGERTPLPSAAKAVRSPSPAAPNRYKVAAPVIFCAPSGADRLALQRLVNGLGGHLAHYAGAQCAVAFTPERGENLGRVALQCASAMVAKGFCASAVIDIANLLVSPRPAGEPPLIGSVAFTQAERYPRTEDGPGLFLGDSARSALLSVSCELVRGGRWRVTGKVTELHTTGAVRQDLPLIGRAPLLAEIHAQARLAFEAKRPRVLTLLGQPGAGKSHLGSRALEELLRTSPQMKVLRFVAREPVGRDPDELLRDVFRQLLRLPEGLDAASARPLLSDRLGAAGREGFGALALLFGWLSEDDREVKNLMAAPGALRAALARAGGEAIRLLAQEGPLCLLLDDVQWFESVTLEALEQASTSPVPLLVVALGRPEFKDSFPRFGQRASAAVALEVAPLDRESALALCRQLLLPATTLPESALGRIVDRAGGSPLLLVELVRGLVRDGLVRPHGTGWSLVTEVLDALPDLPLLDWLTHREVATLRPELGAHAQLLAVLSPQLSAAELEGIIGRLDPKVAELFPLDARASLEQLVRSGVMVARSNGEYAFRHGLARGVIAQPLAKATQGHIHRAALEHYQRASLADALRLPRLAWHAASAGEKELAANTYRALAEDLRKRHNYLEADLSYTRAFEQVDPQDDGARLQMFRGRGIVRYRVARMVDSLADFAEALAIATRQGDALVQADVLLDEAMALDWNYEYRRSAVLTEQAQSVAGADAPPLFRARLLQALGRAASRSSQDRVGVQLLREAAAVAEQLGDEAYEILVTTNVHLGFSLTFLGLTEEAETRLARVEELATQRGDELHLGSMYNNRCCLWIGCNNRPRFMEDVQVLLGIAHRLGNLSLTLNGQYNAGNFLFWRGEYDEAEPYLHRAMEVNARMFQEGRRPFPELLLSRLLWMRGDLDEGRRRVREIQEHQRQATEGKKLELLLDPNDQVLLNMMGLLVDEGSDDAWSALITLARERSQGQELIEILEVRGLVALQRNDAATARSTWEEALRLGKDIPNVMEGRIAGRLAALG